MTLSTPESPKLWYCTILWLIQVFCLNSNDARFLSIWVVLKIMSPCWLCTTLRHLLSRVPKWDPNVWNYPYHFVMETELESLDRK